MQFHEIQESPCPLNDISGIPFYRCLSVKSCRYQQITVVFFACLNKIITITNDMAANYMSIILIIVFVYSDTSVHFRHIMWPYPFHIFLSSSKMCSNVLRSQQTTHHLNHAVRNEFTTPIAAAKKEVFLTPSSK